MPPPPPPPPTLAALRMSDAAAGGSEPTLVDLPETLLLLIIADALPTMLARIRLLGVSRRLDPLLLLGAADELSFRCPSLTHHQCEGLGFSQLAFLVRRAGPRLRTLSIRGFGQERKDLYGEGVVPTSGEAEQFAAAVAHAPLTSLDISDSDSGEEVARALVDALPRSQTITSLDVSWTWVMRVPELVSSLAAVVRASMMTRLATLSIGGNSDPMGCNPAEIVAAAAVTGVRLLQFPYGYDREPSPISMPSFKWEDSEEDEPEWGA